jgi:hypothetical protein
MRRKSVAVWHSMMESANMVRRLDLYKGTDIPGMVLGTGSGR